MSPTDPQTQVLRVRYREEYQAHPGQERKFKLHKSAPDTGHSRREPCKSAIFASIVCRRA